jgi:NAD(P)-dependent dehydrogenase (short-subunit alcohol dehydrogenase family)
MPTVLITGASRGIGLEFVRQYAAAGWKVLACCRKPGTATELNKVTGDVTLFALDVDDDANIAGLARQLKSVPIDVLINNAGISRPEATTLGQVSSEVWLQVFRTNAIAPLKMAEAFLPHLEAGKEKKLIAITSRLGSIELNEGGRYSYRSSKAALNSAWKSLAGDTAGKGMICVVFHPGWVQTDMGGKAAPVTPKQSVAGMAKLISGFGKKDNGTFRNYDGESLPW